MTESAPKLINAHICLECGAVWDRPTYCPLNGAYSSTVPADRVAGDLLRAREGLRAIRSALSYDDVEYEHWTVEQDAVDRLDGLLATPEDRE
ncbi:MAG: hypothetical protein ACRDLD_02305 [Thermoleophilaceae bacterium]